MIRGVLHSDRFADLSPEETWAILLDEGTCLGSVSTFYRVLRAGGEVRERRRQAIHPARVKPELQADGPSRVWSRDITKLHGPQKWTYYHLYVILDIYSRYVAGWMLATRESAALAERLIADTCAKQGIRADQLTIHADRGSSMTSRPVAFPSPISASPSRTADPMSATTTHIRKASSRPSSTGRHSRPGSPRSKTPVPGARNSSPGTTTSTAIPASRCIPRPTSTTGTPNRSTPPAPASWTQPTPATPSDSSASYPHHPRYRPPPGSTSLARKKQPFRRKPANVPHSG